MIAIGIIIGVGGIETDATTAFETTARLEATDHQEVVLRLNLLHTVVDPTRLLADLAP